MTGGSSKSPVRVAKLGFEDWMTRMTYPSYLPVLERLRLYSDEPVENANPEVFAFGAKVAESGIGLCLARRVISSQEVEVLSLFVGPIYRRCGVATALVAKMQHDLQTTGRALRTTFIVDRRVTRALIRVGSNLGWSRPRLLGYHASFDIDRVLASRYFRQELVVRAQGGLAIRPWHDLSDADVDALRAGNEVRRWITRGLEPWEYAYADLHSASRIAVDAQGQVVGWVLLHEVSAADVRIACAFMHHDHSSFARSLGLWKSALLESRQAKYRSCSFVTYAGHGPMVSFLVRRATGLVRVTPIRESCFPADRARATRNSRRLIGMGGN